MLEVKHCAVSLAGMPVGGYAARESSPRVTFKVTRLPAAKRPRSMRENFTTHLRGPSVARPTSGRGHLPTSQWLKDNAERYGIVRHGR